MTHPSIRHFVSSRRSAIAVTMAIALVPLILLIGIAVDITFLSQARTQTAFASQAAAASATRIAAATYSLEVSQGVASSTAAQQAINAANEAGNDWFTADLGNYVRGTLVSGPITKTTYDGGTTGAVSTSAPPNFSATVSSSTSYPPIFDPIFGSTKNWVYGSTASATTQFAYAQVLLLLDTSGSMLIGADPTDITALQEDTVCPANTVLSATNTGNVIPGGFALADGNYAPNDNNAIPTDNDGVTISTAATPNYSGTYSSNGSIGSCNSNYGLKLPNQYASGASGTSPGSPCAFACHWASTPASGYSPDYYGIARRNSSTINLRIDILFKATEQVIQDMQSSEAVASQLSVGVYQFNTDVYSIVNGSTGSNASNQPEATTDLASALTAVNGDDYKQNPSEIAVPQIINGNTVTASQFFANEGGDTDFPLAIKDLEAGDASTLSSSNKLQPMTASGSGNTASTPQKFLIIVTDGFEDDSANNGGLTPNTAAGYTPEGEMTSITAESAKNGVCSYLKNTLGYTIYVLYVQYYPVASLNYYNPASGIYRIPNSYTKTDYGSTYANASVQQLTETPSTTTSPTALALQACASSPNDFAQASDSTTIEADLQTLLKSALSSTIRLTN
jgi:Flp pilus assembly protein TadG